MELVIRVDLDKTQQSLPEIFKMIGDCRHSDEAGEDATSGALRLAGNNGSVIGHWEIEEADERPDQLDSAYRAAATARYFHPHRIEIDRFATVSPTDNGAYVQGWLYVPRADVAAQAEVDVSRKLPKSVSALRDRSLQAG